MQDHALAVAAAHQHTGGGVPQATAVDLAARRRAGHPARGVVDRNHLVSGQHRPHPARLGSGHDRAPHHGHRGGVRHFRAGRPHRQPGDHLHAGGARLRGRRRHPALAPGEMGLRGGVAAARRPRVRPVRAHAAQPRRLRARRPRRGQRHPHQRRPALRRPRPPRVLHPRGHHPARRRDLGQGGGAGDGGGRDARGHRAGGAADPALQEQRRRQGRELRLARELPDGPPDHVPVDRRGPHAVLRHPPGRLRRGPGGPRRVRRRGGLPDLPARRLHRGRGRPGDHPQARHHQHPRRAARRRRQVPPPARHHRRREHERVLHAAQGRHGRAGARHDRGRGPVRRAAPVRAGPLRAPDQPRPQR